VAGYLESEIISFSKNVLSTSFRADSPARYGPRERTGRTWDLPLWSLSPFEFFHLAVQPQFTSSSSSVHCPCRGTTRE